VNILYVYDGPWPKGATRVAKETKALHQAGHVVTLLARNVELAPTNEAEPWMTVRRLPRIPGRGLRYALNFPFMLNPVWLVAIQRAISATRPDLLVVCDLPLAPAVAWIGRMHGLPVHYDMAEVYPEFLRAIRLHERQGPMKRAIRSPRAAELVEAWVLRRVESISVVSEESRRRCIALGVPADRLALVGNTPEMLPDLRRACAIPDDIADFTERGAEILLFVGILIEDRGVRDAVCGLAELMRTRPNAVLVVVGEGPARATAEAEAARLGIVGSVRFVGWKQPEAIEGYYRASHLGLIPFLDSPHVRVTLANKLFDYMAAQLPSLGSDLPPTKRVLEETGAGRVYRAGDWRAFARVAEELLRDPEARTQMGLAGRLAVESIYSWKHDAQRLVDCVASTLKARSAR